MSQAVIESLDSLNLTATGDVTDRNTRLLGFYVNSTTAGTLILKRGGAAGVNLGGLITPAVGFHAYPTKAYGGLHATIGGTLDVTFFFDRGV